MSESYYCSLCTEMLGDDQTECPFCDEPTVLYSDHCEAAYERQCADFHGGSDPLPLIEQQRIAWDEKHGRACHG